MARFSETERGVIASILVFVIFFFVNVLLTRFTGMSSIHQLLQTWHALIPLSIAILAGLGFFLYTGRHKSEDGAKKEKHIDVVEKVLEEDEARIVSIIKSAEGVTQDSLRFRTGFSRAKISLLLKGLEEKGIIAREQSGKTFKLFIGDWLKR